MQSTPTVATIVKNIVSAELSAMGEQIKDLAHAFKNSQIRLRDNVRDLLDNFQRDISKLITPPPCGHPHVLPFSEPQQENTLNGRKQTGDKNTLDAGNKIQNAMEFANNVTALTRNVSIHQVSN